MEKDTPESVGCPNCGHELPASDVLFCPQCGQKNASAKVSMREFMTRFFVHFTHLDNKFVRTVYDLFVPGKMTEVYFRGKRKRYPHPVQLFFIVMFFFLLAANHYSYRAIRVNTSDKTEGKNTADEFIRMMQRHSNSLRLRHLVDSLPAAYRDTHARQAIDSLLLASHDSILRKYQQNMLRSLESEDSTRSASVPAGEMWRLWADLDTVSLKFGPQYYRVDVNDLAWLSEEELAEKYKPDGFMNRLLMKQGIKVIHDPTGLTKAYFGSISWTILVLVGLMSAFLYAIFRKRGRYYIEHFVFLMHWHSALLLLFALVLLLGRVVEDVRMFMIAALIWALVSLSWALRGYYRMGWGKGLGLTALFTFVYAVAFAVVFTGALLVVSLSF